MTRRSGKSELVGVQYLRALAAILVVIHHVLEEIRFTAQGRAVPEWLVTSGAAGVDIFFVISGFIMVYVSFAPGRPAATPGPFFARRLTRIFPFYWLCCLGVLGLAAVGFFSSVDTSPAAIAYSFLLLPYSPLIGVSWTLSYELLFYIAFAVALLARKPALVVASTLAMLAAAMAVGFSLDSGTTLHRFFANPVILEFVCGLAVGLAFLRFGNRAALPLWCGGLALALLIVAPAMAGFDSTGGLDGWPRLLWWGLPSTVILISALRLQHREGVASLTFEKLGDASYAIYLTHSFAMIAFAWALRKGLDAFPVIATGPAVILAAIAGGYLAHIWVEKPTLRLSRKVMDLRQPVAILYQQMAKGAR